MNLPTSPKTQSSTYDTDVAEQVVRLIRLFDRRKLAAVEAAEMVRDYVDVLRGLPLAAIGEAVMRFARGRVEGASKTFAPTPAELYAVADAVDQEQRRRVERETRLKALPPPEDRSKYVGPEKLEQLRSTLAGFAGLQPLPADRIERNPNARRIAPEPEAQARLDKLRAEPIEASPELVQVLADQDKMRA